MNSSSLAGRRVTLTLAGLIALVSMVIVVAERVTPPAITPTLLRFPFRPPRRGRSTTRCAPCGRRTAPGRTW
jgi:hypothetical protein